MGNKKRKARFGRPQDGCKKRRGSLLGEEGRRKKGNEIMKGCIQKGIHVEKL